MLKQQLESDLKEVINALGYQSTDIVCDIPKNSDFGDYTTNIALQLAKQNSTNGKQSPQEIANNILEKLGPREYLEKAEVAGAGFINFFLKNEFLLKNLEAFVNFEKTESSKKILVEYGHVNPLKEIHIGHLRTFILGESLCRIFESMGNEVFRANYQGDIGLHIAKAIWGIQKTGLPSTELDLEEKAKFLGQAYAKGTSEYEASSEAKKEIDEINTALYKKEESIKKLYQLAREWSLSYFNPIYEALDIKYDRCFFESEVFESGKEVVLKNMGKVFVEDQGAVIFPGEKYGLHNRVFITQAGNPTYEGKEIGLAQLEYDTFNYDKSIHVVASEQAGYFQVVIKAIEMLFPHIEGKKYHLSYGFVDLKQGKMSSRTGNVVTFDDILKIVSEKVREVIKESRLEINQELVRSIALGAIKFSYLKYSPEPNIVFDLDQSVSLQGDSGPYVQYTYARIQSVLSKINYQEGNMDQILDQKERLILQKASYFPEIVKKVSVSLHPNILAEYLIDLSRIYNLFYQENRIIGSEKENLRVMLSKTTADILKKGLYLLGIEAPDKM